jgi:arylsulfatase A-like enzyme
MTPRVFAMTIASLRMVTFALLGALCVLSICRAQPAGAKADAAARPNILVIVASNLRWDETGYAGHPFVRTPNLDRLAREGAQFESAFTTTPDAAASFNGLLTGRHATAEVAPSPTVPQTLRDAGYRTFFVGRWPLDSRKPEQVGFDSWVSTGKQSFDPQLQTNRGTETAKGHVTDVLTTRTLQFLEQKNSAPFCVVLLQPVLQGGVEDPSWTIAAERHRRLYANDVPRRRPGRGVTAVPRAENSAASPALSDEAVRNRWRAITALDEGVGRICDALRASGQLERTVVIVTGDRGFLYGEHGITGPGSTAHEESIRVPLLLRYPPAVKRGAEPSQLVLNVDLAPTILQLAGSPAAEQTVPGAGVSLVGLFASKAPTWRFSFLIEGTAVPPGATGQERYEAVRTPAWKYIRYLGGSGAQELYDQHADHYELVNLANRPTAKNELRRWSAELAKVLKSSK